MLIKKVYLSLHSKPSLGYMDCLMEKFYNFKNEVINFLKKIKSDSETEMLNLK